MSEATATAVRSVPALGQKDLCLGALYNIHTGQTAPDPVQDETVKVDKAIKRHVTEICSAGDLFEKLNVSKQLRLDIVLDLVKVSGSAEALLVEEDETLDRAVLICTYSAETHSIDDSYCPEDEEEFTHRAISAVRGARVIILFETPKDSKNPALIDLVTKVSLIRTWDDRGSDKLSAAERMLGKKVTCRVFSDVPLGRHDPRTPRDAVELYQKLTKLMEKAKPVTLSVEISQLSCMPHREKIPMDIVERLLEFISSLRSFSKTCTVLLHDKNVEQFSTLVGKIDLFRKVVSLYEESIVPQIRHEYTWSKAEDNVQRISTLVQEIDQSPFHMSVGYNDMLQNWLNDQLKLVRVLENIKEKERKISIEPVQEARKIIGSTSKKKRSPTVAVFYLGANSEDKNQLTELVTYADNWITDELKEAVHNLNVYEGSTKSMETNLHAFVDFARKSKHHVFILTEERVHDSSEGQVRVYNDGKLLCANFMFPRELDSEPTVIEVSHNSITIDVGEPHVAVKEFYIYIYSQTEDNTRAVRNHTKTVICDGLRPRTLYEISLQYSTVLGLSNRSPVIRVVTAVDGRPAKPEGLQVSEKGCLIKWPRPRELLDSVYRYKGSGLRWEVEINQRDIMTYRNVSGDKLHYFAKLEPGVPYRFRVRASFRLVYDRRAYISKTDFSDPSEIFKLSAGEQQIVKNKSLSSSDLIEAGRPSVYQLKMKNEYTDPDRRLSRFAYGPSSTKPMKTILVVGATGAGKSTLINAFANYLLGVKFEDRFRFRMIDEQLRADQTVSQTKWVTAYVLYHQASFPEEFPFSLTIIDTPGFGDTSGIQADKDITDQLSEYFHTRGHEGIDSLDAIGFVVQASLSRLTPTQQYIFDSILALFGNDVKDNIFVLTTFADGKKAPVMLALDKVGLPYTRAFKFNNSALFSDRSNDARDSDDDSDEEESFDKNFWTMGAASYKKFLIHLSKTTPKSLVLTNQVLDERGRLEAHVAGIQTRIKHGLIKQDALRARLDCLKQHQTDIERNKDFVIEVTSSKIVVKNLPRGHYVTNCLTCNMTCHYPCQIPDDENKWHCWAMQNKGPGATCRVCTGCHWSVHRNTPHKLVIKEVKERKTMNEMKQEYEQACQQQLTTEEFIMKIIEDIIAEEIQTAFLVEQVRTSLQNLSMIALKPHHMTTVGYIDTLIESEKQQAEYGWHARVRQLHAVRERAETVRKVAEHQGNTEPWESFRKEMEVAKRSKSGGFIDFIKGWIPKSWVQVFRR